MERKLLLFVLAALLGAVIAVGATASPPAPASGTLTYLASTFNSVRLEGGNAIIDLSADVSYTGTLSGTSHLHGVLIFHPDGTANFHDTETFTGTVDGIAGSVTFNLKGSSDPNLVVTGTSTVVDASGGLAGLHGVLDISAVVLDKLAGPVGTYSGQLGFSSAA